MPRSIRTKIGRRGAPRIRAELSERLTRIANEIARGQNMPSMHESDHEFRQATPRSDRRHVIEDAERANGQCQEWAFELLGLVDLIGTRRGLS